MSEINIKNRLGFHRQKSDSRDFRYSAVHFSANTLPPRVDLRTLCPPVYDQKNLGSCVGNGTAFAVHFDLLKQKRRVFAPSRLFIYYNAREMEGTSGEDAGANIRDGFKSIGTQGVCSENAWKYDIAKFAKKPLKKCYTSAARHTAINYSAVGQTLNELKACLADGFVFVFGFTVYESFERIGKDGVMSYPQQSEQILGGHAVCAVGYDDETQMFTIANSWSKAWGQDGFFHMPYSVITNRDLASDFWTVRTIN